MYLDLTEDEKIDIKTSLLNNVIRKLDDVYNNTEFNHTFIEFNDTDHVYCDFYGTDYMLTVGYHVFKSYFEVQVQDFTITEFSYSSHDCILNNFAKEFAIEGKTEVLNSRDEVLQYLMQVQVPSLDFNDYED